MFGQTGFDQTGFDQTCKDVRPAAMRLTLGCIALFLVCFVVLLLCMDRSVAVYDEGLILFGAQRTGAGELLHRDFYANYGPGNFVVLAALFRWFSASVLVERLWDNAVRSAIVVLVVLLVRSGDGRPIGGRPVGGRPVGGRAVLAGVAGLVSLAWLGFYGTYGYPVFPALALALAVVLCLQPVLAGLSRAPGRLVAAGVMAGATGLFRYDAGVLIAGCAGLALLVDAVLGRRERRLAAIARVLVPFGAGVALVAMPLAGFYLAAGALPAMILDVVQRTARSYATMRGLPFLRPALADPEVLGSYLPILAALAGIIALVPAWLSRRTARPGFSYLLLLTLLTLGFLAKGYVRFSAVHMSAALIVGVVLVFSAASRRPAAERPSDIGRGAVVVALVVIVLGTVTALRFDFWQAQRNRAWLAQGADCSVPTGLDRMRCFTIDHDESDAIGYIRRVTAPGTPLFVGLGRHDKILLNDVVFYFLADRPSATRWHHMDPGVQTTAPVQLEMIAELQGKRPPYIVLETNWDNAHEPNGSAVSSGVVLLDDYLRANFAAIASFGSIQVLRAHGTAGG